MFRISRASRYAAVLGLLVLLPACSEDDDPAGPDPTYDPKPVVERAVVSVILPTYRDLAAKAATLRTACAVLDANNSEQNLEAARSAWRAARAPWESSEGFLFGPVSNLGLDPAIDSWPVNTVDLDAVLASSDALTPEYVAGLEATLKGFHTLEYLLFGTSGDRDAASFSARELDYVTAMAANLEEATATLVDSWEPASGNFGRELIEAGAEGRQYASLRAAMQELLVGMIGIADEVANGKIEDPFSRQEPELEESRFSANSIADFQDNIRSIRNLWRGGYAGSDGTGFRDFVVAHDAAAATQVGGAIDEAIAAIGAIPAPFSAAIFDHRTDVENAQQAVRDLQDLLETKITPLLDEL